jgi:hypothetical protein
MGSKRANAEKRGNAAREPVGGDLSDWAKIFLIVFAVSLLMWLSLLGSVHLMSLPLPR